MTSTSSKRNERKRDLRRLDDRGALDLVVIGFARLSAATVGIEPFGFAPTVEVPFRTVIAEITPDEYQRLRIDPAALKHPSDWELSSAEEITRPPTP